MGLEEAAGSSSPEAGGAENYRLRKLLATSTAGVRYSSARTVGPWERVTCSRAPYERPMPIRRVWIDEGCIACDLCEDLCPEVFEVPAGRTSLVRKKYARHLGRADVQENVREAADSCPVEVIKFEDHEPSS